MIVLDAFLVHLIILEANHALGCNLFVLPTDFGHVLLVETRIWIFCPKLGDFMAGNVMG